MTWNCADMISSPTDLSFGLFLAPQYPADTSVSKALSRTKVDQLFINVFWPSRLIWRISYLISNQATVTDMSELRTQNSKFKSVFGNLNRATEYLASRLQSFKSHAPRREGMPHSCMCSLAELQGKATSAAATISFSHNRVEATRSPSSAKGCSRCLQLYEVQLSSI